MQTSDQLVSAPQRRASVALAAPFLGMFVLGSGELLAVGLLNLISADLEVSVRAAGALVTAYAVGLAIGGPILTALTIRLDRRYRGGLVRRWRGHRHLHSLVSSHHRAGHRFHLHPGRLGHQLAQAAGDHGCDRARSSDSVTPDPTP
jgi:hypothetical protein